MDTIPVPANVDIGDAIKAMKSLYSVLRQLEFGLRRAEMPLHGTVREAVHAMERDVSGRRAPGEPELSRGCPVSEPIVGKWTD